MKNGAQTALLAGIFGVTLLTASAAFIIVPSIFGVDVVSELYLGSVAPIGGMVLGTAIFGVSWIVHSVTDKG